MMTTAFDMRVYIGAIYGGPEQEQSPLWRAELALSQANAMYFDSQGISHEAAGGVGIVFHLYGSILKPEFEGIRTSTFSRKQKLIQIQVAVPRAVNDLDEIHAFLALRDLAAPGIELGIATLAKKGLKFPHPEYLDYFRTLKPE